MAEVRALSCMHCMTHNMFGHFVSWSMWYKLNHTLITSKQLKAYYSRIMLSANATKFCLYYSEIMPS